MNAISLSENAQNMNKNNFFTRRIASFGHAFRGLSYVLATQTNAKIHIFATFCVVVAGYISHLSITEWCILTVTISTVIAMEIMNTALETLTDLVSPEYNKLAGIAKDAAAAAVLVTAIGAIVVGLLIFMPKWM
jgi:diacylglycerol kinase (ATP)